MSYRSDLDALEARHQALEAEVASRTRELDSTKQLLDDARARVSLPILDNIKVAAPCAADWSKMTGDALARHCADCNKNVYNLSEMTRDEAQALLIEKEGKLCVRYYRRHDGTILTADCPVGTKRRRRRKIVAAGAIAMLAGAVAGFFVRRRPTHEALMGDVGPVAEPAPKDVLMGKVSPPPPTVEMGGSGAPVFMGQPVMPATAPK
jgi:hypothetical protein